ncbi:hypothetical protein FOA52_005501 [Chlamydomonas sp. UWO 241]|nr:hypothetical protein FOA52_005501 [Chlamydomonas sp. UWO 241]
MMHDMVAILRQAVDDVAAVHDKHRKKDSRQIYALSIHITGTSLIGNALTSMVNPVRLMTPREFGADLEREPIRERALAYMDAELQRFLADFPLISKPAVEEEQAGDDAVAGEGQPGAERAQPAEPVYPGRLDEHDRPRRHCKLSSTVSTQTARALQARARVRVRALALRARVLRARVLRARELVHLLVAVVTAMAAEMVAIRVVTERAAALRPLLPQVAMVVTELFNLVVVAAVGAEVVAVQGGAELAVALWPLLPQVAVVGAELVHLVAVAAVAVVVAAVAAEVVRGVVERAAA